MSWYKTVLALNENDLHKGMRLMTYDGLCSHAMTLLVTGAFLPGMALALGANNFVIGILGSLAPVSQMIQIPSILLVERVRMRKLITVIFAFLSRLSLVGAALVPFMPTEHKVAFFLFFMIAFFLCGSVAGCAWNSWIKDIVPSNILGAYFAKRLSKATLLGIALTLVTAFGLESLISSVEEPSMAYGLVFVIAACVGLLGAYVLTRVPEPQMAMQTQNHRWISSLMEPARDPNFRKLLIFSGSWSFTVTMAAAFMAVYMLNRIGLSMITVIMLAILSQFTNVYFFKIWGNIADRFSNKSVLRVSVPLFLIVILLYPFTTMPEKYFLTIPLLIFIHILGGISTAGFNLCAANIALKLAPQGKATTYLATNAFCSGISAAIAPIIGGLIGGFFAIKEISMKFLYYHDTAKMDEMVSIPALSFRGIDFVFFASAIVGFYAIHRLSLIEEAGTIDDKEVRENIYSSVRTSLTSLTGFSMGLRRMSAFPYETLVRSGKTASSMVSGTLRKKNFKPRYPS